MIGEGTLQGGRTAGEPPHELVELARQRGFIGDSQVRQAIADLWLRSVVSAEASARAMARVRTGDESPHVGSALKLFGTDLTRMRAHVAMMVAGPRGIAWSSEEPLGESWARTFLSSRSAGIGGGTDEIQRNIIGDRILGLARDVQVDRTLPFREIPTSRRT
jgi:alkylation response protein AidB-like acyl-CoA dehydrogenase